MYTKRMKKLYISALLAVLASLTLSCKKDNSTTSYPSLSGLSITQQPPYVSVGDVLTFEYDRSDITVSTGSMPVVGIYWQVNSAKRDTLTENIAISNPAFTYKVDTLGNYTVTCNAYAGSEYYGTSASSEFQAIDPATALTGTGANTTATIAGKTWTAVNLSTPGSGLAYKYAEVSSQPLGRYYTWQEATTACPSGWHLPSAAEWDTLGEDAGELMADAYFLEEKMWEYWPGVNITNSTGFNAIPAGYADRSFATASFSGLGEYAAFWTADSTGDTAEYRYIIIKQPKIHKGQGSITSLALSVRCVKD